MAFEACAAAPAAPWAPSRNQALQSCGVSQAESPTHANRPIVDSAKLCLNALMVQLICKDDAADGGSERWHDALRSSGREIEQLPYRVEGGVSAELQDVAACECGQRGLELVYELVAVGHACDEV